MDADNLIARARRQQVVGNGKAQIAALVYELEMREAQVGGMTIRLHEAESQLANYIKLIKEGAARRLKQGGV